MCSSDNKPLWKCSVIPQEEGKCPQTIYMFFLILNIYETRTNYKIQLGDSTSRQQKWINLQKIDDFNDIEITITLN